MKIATNEKNGKSVSDCMLMAERNGSEKERERERVGRKPQNCFLFCRKLLTTINILCNTQRI